jgi:2-polyprenyl-3-methyl-5-hydroxy-6-metoxy-1,4-benzoquinol methylase
MKTWTRRFWIARRIIARRFFKILGKLNLPFRKVSRFEIRPEYHHANSILDFDDTPNKEEWQKEVYLLAASIAKNRGYSSVIDLGCGSAFKLIKYLGFCKTTGIETTKTYHWLKEKYPQQHWISFEETDASRLESDLLICADVIEHIDNPDLLLQFIRSINAKQIVISTPERDKNLGKKDIGPPENPFHFREWNADEFRKYISSWFVIEEQCIFSDRSVTQVIICKK